MPIGMEMKLQVRLSQQLVMTPQLVQAIRLLQLSRLELVEIPLAESLHFRRFARRSAVHHSRPPRRLSRSRMLTSKRSRHLS